MNQRTMKITMPALLTAILSIAGTAAAGPPICSLTSNITQACTITKSGTYTLGGNITVTSSNGNSGSICNNGGFVSGPTGICIACTNSSYNCSSGSPVTNVTINLNGWKILAGSGALAGIANWNAASTGLTVRNGTIDGRTNGFQYGANLGTQGDRVEHLTVNNSSGSIAVNLGDTSVMLNTTITESLNVPTTAMALCGNDCLISGNTLTVSGSLSGVTGIATFNGGILEGNTVTVDSSGTSLSLSTGAGFGENTLNATCASGGTSMKNNTCNGVHNS